MARQLRIQFEGALYHIISRGNERMMIFLDEADRTKYLNILNTTIERFNWLCHAYCLMENHYHLMIETPDANLAKGMKYLNQVYRGKDHRRWRGKAKGERLKGTTRGKGPPEVEVKGKRRKGKGKPYGYFSLYP